MAKIKDMTGLRFGRLLVESFYGTDCPKRSEAVWLCKCDCGQTRTIRGSSLRLGLSKSCGCIGVERALTLNRTHGQTSDGGSDTYKTWISMIRRCREKHEAYKTIEVCDEWKGREGFSQFLADMGERPEGMTLDRTDPKGNYNKENCRWADVYLQAQNKGQFKNNSSGKTGVHFREDRILNPWIASITVRCKVINLGSYPDFESAKQARIKAELEHFGFEKE